MSRFGLMGHVPPPPAGPSLASRQMMPERDEAPPEPRGEESPRAGKVYPFDAELEMAELDERGKSGAPWSARARTLSRSAMSVCSRRMCYVDRRVLVAVHRVDDEPVILLGRVVDCRYESDGLHTIDLELLPINEAEVRLSYTRRPGV